MAPKAHGKQHQKTISNQKGGAIPSQGGVHGQKEDEQRQNRHRRATPASLLEGRPQLTVQPIEKH